MDGRVKEITGPPTTGTSTRTVRWVNAMILGTAALAASHYTTSIALPLLSNPFKLSPIQTALLAAAPFITGTLSSIVIMPLADRIGRRLALLLTVIVIVVGAGVSGFAGHFAVLLAGRLIGGAGLGVAVLCRLYAEELFSVGDQPAFLAIQDTFTAVGCLLSFIVGCVCQRFNHSLLALLSPIIPSLIVFISVITTLPESPRWLYSCDRREEAHEIAIQLQSEHIEQERLPETVESWHDLRRKKYWRPLVAVVSLAVAVSAVALYYHLLYHIFHDPKLKPFTEWLDVLLVVAVGIPAVCGSLIYNIVTLRLNITRTTSRKTLIYTLIAYSVILIALGATSFFRDKLIIAFVVVSLLGCASLCNSVILQLTSNTIMESLPQDIRTRGVSFAHSAATLTTLIITFTLTLFVKTVRWALPLVYGISALVTLLMAAGLRTVVEGKGVVEQVEAVHRLSVVPAGSDCGDDENHNQLQSVIIPKPPPTP